MTYREFNNAWLNSDSLVAKKAKENDENCAYIENLIYQPFNFKNYMYGLDGKSRNWDDEISEEDKAYLTKVCRPKFIETLNW